MSITDYIISAVVYLWSVVDKNAIFGFLIAMTVSSLQGWKQGKFRIPESLLCGVFAAIGVTSAQFIGSATGLRIPDGAYAFVAGAIGYFGTDSTVAFIKSRFGPKESK